MLVQNALIALMGLAVAADATAIRHPSHGGLTRRQNRNGGGNRFGGGGGGQGGGAGAGAGAGAGGNNNAGGGAGAGAGAGAGGACLAANAIQKGSQSTGQSGATPADGQVNSATDNANFINFCSGKTLTDGAQKKQGSCNGIVMGDIPAFEKMVSTVILNPKNLDTLPPNQSFDIQVKIANMKLGAFTNATSTYYSAPQTLDGSGVVIGHTHVTVQDIGNNLNPTEPLDATKFVFFKGINDAGNGAGTLKTTVTGGLPAGNYRLCTMSGSSNHQPVLMPVAQRGAQEDCRYFTVAAGGGAGNNAGGNNNAGGGAGAGAGAGAGGNNNANPGGANNAGGGAGAGAGAGGGAGNNAGGNNNAGGGAGAGAGAGAAAGGNNNANPGGTNNAGGGAGAGTGAGAGGNNAGTGGGAGKGGNAGGGAGAGGNAGKPATTSAAAPATTSKAAGGGAGAGAGGNTGKPAATTTSAAAPAATSKAAAVPPATGGKAALGGVACPKVENSGDRTRPFKVNGDTFVNKAAAVQRACAIQNNGCANAVNSGKVKGATVIQCNQQERACVAAGAA